MTSLQILAAYRMASAIPVYDEFGSYASTKAQGFNNGRNPVRILTNNGNNDYSWSLYATGNVYFDFHPIEDLNIRSSIGGNLGLSNYVNYGYRYLGDSEPQNSNNFGEGSVTVLHGSGQILQHIKNLLVTTMQRF